MAARYSDSDIAKMVREQKRLPGNWRSLFRLLDRRGHRERQLRVTGGQGNECRLILRQSRANPLDFSAILALAPADSSQLFRLRRYNGKSHQHTNKIEGNTFCGFHIHQATERYQEYGGREDAYAELSDRYADLSSAIGCLLEDCGFVAPEGEPPAIFGELAV